MLKKAQIEVNVETVNLLQRLNYDVSSRRDTICYLLDQHKSDPDDSLLTSKVFESYQSQLSSLDAEYQLAKDEMIRTHVDESILQKITNWHLDFGTHILSIEYNE